MQSAHGIACTAPVLVAATLDHLGKAPVPQHMGVGAAAGGQVVRSRTHHTRGRLRRIHKPPNPQSGDQGLVDAFGGRIQNPVGIRISGDTADGERARTSSFVMAACALLLTHYPPSAVAATAAARISAVWGLSSPESEPTSPSPTALLCAHRRQMSGHHGHRDPTDHVRIALTSSDCSHQN